MLQRCRFFDFELSMFESKIEKGKYQAMPNCLLISNFEHVNGQSVIEKLQLNKPSNLHLFRFVNAHLFSLYVFEEFQ